MDNINAVTNMYYDTATHASTSRHLHGHHHMFVGLEYERQRCYRPGRRPIRPDFDDPHHRQLRPGAEPRRLGHYLHNLLISAVFLGTFAGPRPVPIGDLTINAPIQNPSTTPTTTITDVYGPFFGRCSADQARPRDRQRRPRPRADKCQRSPTAARRCGLILRRDRQRRIRHGKHGDVLGNGAGLIASVTGTTVKTLMPMSPLPPRKQARSAA